MRRTAAFGAADCPRRPDLSLALRAAYTMDEPYDPRFLAGIQLFNECEFFEAHDVWEELWSDYQGPSRKFYQGLIQVAVCLHHFGNGNTRGAKKLYYGSRSYLEEYRPQHLGVDLEKLFVELERCCSAILSSTEEYPTAEIVPDWIPEIHLNPPAR